MGATLAKAAAAVVLVLVVQLELFSDVRVLGVMPELPLGLTIAAGWQGGSKRGAVVGFAIGVLYDLFLPTPLALNALTYALIGHGVGLVAEVLADGVERVVRRILGMAAVTIGLVLFMILGELLDAQNLYNDDFPRIVLIATLYTGLLLPALHRLMRWAFVAPSLTGPRGPGLVE